MDLYTEKIANWLNFKMLNYIIYFAHKFIIYIYIYTVYIYIQYIYIIYIYIYIYIMFTNLIN